MKVIQNVLAVAAVATALSACAQKHDEETAAPSGAVDSATIRAHMQVLAADDMEGREAGTRGFLRAARYVADAFSKAGLQPVGDDASYYQNINFISTRLVADSGKVNLHKEGQNVPLIFGEDFVQYGGYGQEEDSITAPLVFAGFGINAPEYGHNDYADIDIAGKIVVLFSGAPPSFAANERAFYSSSDEKRRLAAAQGAVGVITVYTPVDQKRIPWSRIQSRIGSIDMRWTNEDGVAAGGFPGLPGSVALSDQGARKLFETAGRDLDALFDKHMSGGLGGIDLGVSASVSRRSIQEPVSAPNVIGLLTGNDPQLSDEVLIYSAHLDHLGLSRDGNETFNGAYDNAAGVGIILEIAQAMSEMSEKPRRSIIFVAYTAEEKGLRGSDYLAHHPPVAIENIVANINVDMPFLGYPIADVEGFGVEHSSLERSLKEAAAFHELHVTPDSRPELVRLIRSDQFSFVKKGVPGLNIKPGTRSSDPNVDGEALRDEFLSEHYHKTSDDLDLPFSVEATESFARTVFDLGLIVSNDQHRPRWNDGDFFGERFASERASP